MLKSPRTPLASVTLRLALVASIALVGLPAGAARAQASHTVAVAPFQGRGSGVVRRLVGSALSDAAQVLPRGRVTRAARRAGVSGTDPSGVADLAADLGADIVVQGRVAGPRRRPRIELIFLAADGAELARGPARYRRGRRGRRVFNRDVEELYQQAVGALEARRPPPPEPELAPEPILDEEDPAGAEGDEQEPSEAPEDGLALVSIVAGLSVRTRDASIELAEGGRRRYELQSGVYPEILLGAEVRPLAHDAGLARGVFVDAAFAHSVGLGSEAADGTTVSTNFVRFALGAGWLAPLDPAFELGLGLWGGYDGYHLGPNAVLPTAEYAWLRPGARARVRFAQETFVLDVGLGYRAVLGIGDLRSSFGQDGDAHGFDFGLGIGGNLLQAAGIGLTWGVRFDYVAYFLSFGGAAADAQAESGSESAVRVSFLAGYSF